ncbi:aspartate/glutamate racemase family protein [Paraburkholderia sp. Tr-20389]|uniref:aspartate/glutamate racemase family protein n=1 Tax=Paraburkholderia sp. Tr-20389 TaxID=2703903 RepID=UPI00197E541B|nr:amino acid racemase [Paraburkholderia sp. Tr-20389]MBN3752105.1 aspartate/glutamate racemase family protein [Paraburkholderia sp. Tr-20389]
MTPVIAEHRRKYGIVGGLGPLASADVFFKLVKALPSSTDAEHADLIFQQHPFRSASAGSAATTERKLYIFEMIRDFEKQGVTTVVLPCFLSHTFIDELKTNTSLQIVDMVDAVRQHVRKRMHGARRIGILASDFTREKRLFERYFISPEFEVVYPRLRDGVDLVTEAVYGGEGIKSGNLRGRPVELLHRACADLIEQGVDVIVPGMTEIALVADEIRVLSVPLVDSNLVYAQQVVSGQYDSPSSVFKVGVVGGVGPAATIDFLDKVVRNTPATRDQDHIRLIVEQNPQIPDRTENLIGNGADPTVSLYATCKRLEEGDADIIAIPCNTAHAFVERIQPYLGIPIVNMLTETVRYVCESWPAHRDIGVLATSGTIASGVYEKALESQGLRQVAPDEALQKCVMAAIYGNNGVKAGFTTGRCQEDIAAAVEGLIAQGVEIIILGCTELPLLLPLAEFIGRNGKRARLVDPTDVLARRCIAYATAARDSARAAITNSLTLPA